jgi:hypothetical protein
VNPLAFIAAVSHRQQASLRRRFRCADAVIAAMLKLGWIEYHSAVTWSVRVTAKGRAELKRQRGEAAVRGAA